MKANPMPKHYNDFVFKDGELIGQFEDMYQQSQEVPWHQDKLAGELNVRLSVEMLKEAGPFDRIHEFGMGLGYFLRHVRSQLGSDDIAISGSDISQTACNEAAKLTPGAEFWVQDFMQERQEDQPTAVGKGRGLFLVRGLFWYVFPQIDRVVDMVAAAMGPEDSLFVAQNFPPLESTFVGKAVIPNPDALMDKLGQRFDPLNTLYLENHVRQTNDNWLLGVFAKRSD